MGREITVEHGEMDGSPVENRTAIRFDATRKVICAWSERHLLCAQALAWPGHEYPYDTGSVVKAYCSGASIQPLPGKQDDDDGETKRASYENAIVTLKYETPGRDTPRATGGGTGGISSSGKKFIELIEPHFENVILPHEKFQWGTGASAEPLLPDEAPTKTIAGDEYTFRVLNTTFIPNAARRLRGHVNAGGVYTKLGNVFYATETLLFMGAIVERTSEHLGGDLQERMDVVYKFMEQPNGWNRFPRAVGVSGVTTFAEIYLREGPGTPHKIHPTGSFLELTF